MTLGSVELACEFRVFFFFSSRRRHTRFDCDWSSDVCSSDLGVEEGPGELEVEVAGVQLGVAQRHEPRVRGAERGEPARDRSAAVRQAQRVEEIGRASCRGKSVDLGGRRIIKKKKKKK